jgi:methylmalonyl-CoA mutase
LPVLAEFHPQFTKWISDEGCDLSKINGSIRIQNPHKNDVSPEVLLEYSRNIETSLPNMKTICWNLLWSKDEEGLTQSMCTFFSDIIHYLSKIQSQESIQKLLKKSILKVEITSNYIFEIIRLRAIRLLWNNLLLANEINQGPISLEVHFSPQSYFEEPDKNMIVASTMALSAIVGGADSVYILPSDANPESHDKHKRRIARNIHHIFRFECYLEKHLDPVKGAYFFESTVQQLVERVWERCLQ